LGTPATVVQPGGSGERLDIHHQQPISYPSMNANLPYFRVDHQVVSIFGISTHHDCHSRKVCSGTNQAMAVVKGGDGSWQCGVDPVNTGYLWSIQLIGISRILPGDTLRLEVLFSLSLMRISGCVENVPTVFCIVEEDPERVLSDLQVMRQLPLVLLRGCITFGGAG
jgi:hypothetical protein